MAGSLPEQGGQQAVGGLGSQTSVADDQQGQANLATPPIEQPGIQPVAEPTAVRFRTPGLDDGASQNLLALARSLQNLDGGISAYLDARDQQQQQQDAAAAKLAAIRNNGEGYAQAVAEGKIPAQASPTYVSSYREDQGELAGLDLQAKANQAYDNWGGKTSLDPNAYRTFITGFLSQNIGPNTDPDVLKGMMPQVNQLVSELQQRHIADVHNDLTQGRTNTTVALADKGVEAQRNKAAATGQDFDPNAAWASTMAYRDNFLKTGGTPGQIDNKIVDMITSQAEQANPDQGKQILTLLDRPIPGTTYTYGDTPYGSAKKLEAGNYLEKQDRQNLEDLQKLQTQANKEELGTVQTAALNWLVQNPGKPVPDALIAAGSKTGLDPEFRYHLAQWQDTLLKNAGTSDPQDILNLHWSIVNGNGPAAIAEAMNEGKIHTAAELDAALKLAAQTQKAQNLAAPMLKSEAAKGIMTAIEGRTRDYLFGPPDDNGVQPLLPRPGVSDAGLGLQLSFTKQVQQWAIAHPGATDQEQQDAIAQIGAGVLKTIQEQSTETTRAKVTPPPASAGPNPYFAQPTLPPGAPMAPPPAQPAPPLQPQPQPPLQQRGAIDPAQQQQQQAQQWYAGLQPQQQAKIRAAAASYGQDLNSVIAGTYAARIARSANNAGGGAAQPQPPLAAPAGSGAPGLPPVDGPTLMKGLTDAFNGWRESNPNSPRVLYQLQQSFLAALHNQGNPIGGYTVAALKDNPKAAHILDFISGPESNGNYNAYFGHANSGVDLSGLTLNQVLAWQQERVGAGSPSSATGRYQFTQATLHALKSAMHLTGGERFTPELQDQMALQLLKERGYAEWVSGKLSDAEFANNLSEEWASLPNVHTGQSHYQGDGLNHALVTPSQVSRTLAAARNIPDAPPEAEPDNQGGEDNDAQQ